MTVVVAASFWFQLMLLAAASTVGIVECEGFAAPSTFLLPSPNRHGRSSSSSSSASSIPPVRTSSKASDSAAASSSGHHASVMFTLHATSSSSLSSVDEGGPDEPGTTGGSTAAAITTTDTPSSSTTSDPLPPPPQVFTTTLHHSAISTRNITLAMQFYSLFGFEPTEKFRAGPAKVAWLEQRQPPTPGAEGDGPPQGTAGPSSSSPPPPLQRPRILELIEIPPHILKEPEGKRKRALNLYERPDLLGHNHIALDVTQSARDLGCPQNLTAWMDLLNGESVRRFGRTLNVAIQPTQQILGNAVYWLAFLYDADGALVELLCKAVDLPQQLDSGWDPTEWQGFSSGLSEGGGAVLENDDGRDDDDDDDDDA
jgi:hypothetical protein